MKLLKLLTEVTNKKYCILSYFKSCREMGIDSLTYIEYISQIEKLYSIEFSDNMLIVLYSTKLFKLKSAIHFLR